MIDVQTTEIPGVLLIQPKIFGDSRGAFFESYNEKTWRQAGIEFQFVQDNQSLSSYGVLRGLHFQKGQYAQTKLLRVARGHILDVIVDLRPDSPTFKKARSFELDDKKGLQILIPKQMAHGFIVLSEEATVVYKCDSFYSPKHEGGIHPLDSDLNIDWRVLANKMIISDKDKKLPSIKTVLAERSWELK